MSCTTFMFMSFSAEIIYYFEMLFGVAIFLKFKFFTDKIESHENMIKKNNSYKTTIS
jgi:hypothetical protein